MKKLIYVADKAYDTVFQLEDLEATFEVVDQLWKDGSKKTAAGKLVALDEANASTPNLRVFCTLRIDGVNNNFMQELTKMNGAGFDTCIDAAEAAKGNLVVKTGAKIRSIGGVVTYHM